MTILYTEIKCFPYLIPWIWGIVLEQIYKDIRGMLEISPLVLITGLYDDLTSYKIQPGLHSNIVELSQH